MGIIRYLVSISTDIALGEYNKDLLEGEHLKDKTITVINRSEIVGRPLAAMLANDGATVYALFANMCNF